ncbi:hypothetical protein DXG01_008668 [Tephrocybe rancida]|nr:hypothetical protein DXG01_008668 [Tephrocybe rancida]
MQETCAVPTIRRPASARLVPTGTLAPTHIDSINLSTPSQLLDLPDLTPHFRKSLSVATHRLSARSGLYPACYESRDVVQEGEYPVNAGGFADIYKGKFQGRVVCLKAIRLYQTDQIEHMLKATSKEAILWRQLLHPNVLTLFGLYRFQNRVSIVTAWMENGDINVYLKKNPAAPRQRLAADVANGLAYLHDNKIIHGDLKGPNILVDDTSRARLADFGISSISDSQIIAWTTRSSDSTKAGGSIRWQAPELFAVGDSDLDDDEVEVAVKNTMIFTGEVPFSSITRDTTVILRVKSGARPARPPSSSLSWTEWGLTEDMWACIEDCWNAQPTERPLVDAVAKSLAAHLGEDMRQEDTEMHLPDEFRRWMSESLEMITVDDLNRILETRLELADEEMKDSILPPILGSSASSGTLFEQILSPSSEQSDELFIHALNSQIAESNTSEAFAQSDVFPTKPFFSLDLAQPTLHRSKLGEPRLRSETGISWQRASPSLSPKAEGRTDVVMDFDLKGHIGSHEEKPFKCHWPACGKGFAQQQDCKRHEQLHTNHCPFSCDACGKQFSTMDLLKRHRSAQQCDIEEGEAIMTGIGIGGGWPFTQIFPMPFNTPKLTDLSDW